MNPRKSMIAALALTAVVVVTVLGVGARLGAFGLGEGEAFITNEAGVSPVEAAAAPNAVDGETVSLQQDDNHGSERSTTSLRTTRERHDEREHHGEREHEHGHDDDD
jgi:hypothetical protein